MDLLNKLGIASFILTIIALYVLPLSNLGWLIFLPSYAIQIYIFYKTKQWFLIGQMAVLFIFSSVNFFR
jgi:hypothetical protein